MIVRLPNFGLVCLLLIVGLFISIIWQQPFDSRRWRRRNLLIFTQVLFYPAIVAIGALFRVDSNPMRPRAPVNPFADWALDITFFLSLALGLYWIYEMKRLRWFAFCFVFLVQLVLFGAMFVAGMSITGDWL